MTATVEALTTEAEKLARQSADLERKAEAARAERDALAARLEAERKAAGEAWAQAILEAHPAASATARQAVAEARAAFEHAVLETDIGRAYLAVIAAEADVYRVSADRVDALAVTGRASALPVHQPVFNLAIELGSVLDRHGMDLLDAADRQRRQDRADAIAAKVVTE